MGRRAGLTAAKSIASPMRKMGLGFYTAISKLELSHSTPVTGKFDVELKPGWNSLLIKISTSIKVEWEDMQLCLRMSDPPDIAYETKNILWTTPLPGRSTSTPIIVKDPHLRDGGAG